MSNDTTAAPSSPNVPLLFTSTCDMYDAVLDRAVRVPSLQWRSYGKIQQFSGAVVVTVRCVNATSRIKETLATAPPQERSVLVVDGSASLNRCALLGDQIAQSAIDPGWAGIVIVGCVRDVEILETMGIVTVALGSTPRKSTRRGEGQVNERIQVGDCFVHPGDLVFVDRNRVLFLDPSVVPTT